MKRYLLKDKEGTSIFFEPTPAQIKNAKLIGIDLGNKKGDRSCCCYGELVGDTIKIIKISEYKDTLSIE
jgi:hypothetical protein